LGCNIVERDQEPIKGRAMIVAQIERDELERRLTMQMVFGFPDADRCRQIGTAGADSLGGVFCAILGIGNHQRGRRDHAFAGYDSILYD
jgi:hypothetical protein